MSQTIGYATDHSFTVLTPPRRKPAAISADRAHDGQPLHEELCQRGIMPFLDKRGEEHGSGLGVCRWVVERTLAWFKGFRCLRPSFERTACMHKAAPTLAACLVCFRALQAHLKMNS